MEKELMISRVAHIIQLAEEKTAGYEMKIENTISRIIADTERAERERIKAETVPHTEYVLDQNGNTVTAVKTSFLAQVLTSD
jgi:hypothetical protein